MINLDCVQCGYCCTVGPCFYGEWDSDRKCCKYLTEPNDKNQKFCKKYDDIVKFEKQSNHPMMGSGCSSCLFNEVRENVIRKL